MFELMFCSMLTILPDYLFRRYGQGKRFGTEITLFTVWYELRWGITACLILTISLITVVFYFHPASNNVTSFFRTIPVLPETAGRVTEIYVGLSDDVKAGQPLFKLDTSLQETALETAEQKVLEIDAELVLTQTDLARADGIIGEAESFYKQALDELETKLAIRERNPDTVTLREIERLQNSVDGRASAIDVAKANKFTIETNIKSLLPAKRASAVAEVAQAQAALDKMTIYAGVDGSMEQFTLRVGDYVNPVLRPAGILVPRGAGTVAFQAGFGQISTAVVKVGMAAEMTCRSRPFVVIPMVVTEVQDVISSGQLRQSDLLVDASQVVAPGSLMVYMEPMFEGGIDGIAPGSTCMANLYTSNHDRLQTEDLSTAKFITLHAIDAVGLVHAMLLRLQVMIIPVRSLVLTGGH